MNKSIVLIGGSGFIGLNFANYFFSNNYRVRIICRNKFDMSKLISNKIEIYILDIKETNKLLNAISGFENIIWLANTLIPGIKTIKETDAFNDNVFPIINFFKNNNDTVYFKKFIYISSGGTIYGNNESNSPSNETSKTDPISLYGKIKLQSENYIKYYKNTVNSDIYIIRPSNVYGIYQNFNKPQGIIGFLFKSVLENGTIDIYGDGNIIRDYINVSDLAFAIFLCVENLYFNNKLSIYNIGSDIGYTINDVISLINTITNHNIKTNVLPPREFDCNFNILDSNKIKNELNWKAETNLKEGLTTLWNWYKTNNL
jgi:UDP-glucose 4-epimerase